MSMFEELLNRIAPYVVVCGSFAKYKENEDSDIDCFLRSRPIEEVDPEIGNDTYMPEILEIIKEYDLVTDSVLVGHIAIERQFGIERMIEISSHYKIPKESKLFYRTIHGVPFLCGQDDKNADSEECWDCPVWDDEICDMKITHPIPKYNTAEME